MTAPNTEVRFYHLSRQTEMQVLPVMLQTALGRGQRAVVKFSDAAALSAMDEHLWTFKPDAFLPHGTAKTGAPERQPVWLTLEDENPNKADILFLCSGAVSEMIGSFSLCCEMLDGSNQSNVEAARGRWKTYKEQGFAVTYWQQGDQGGCEKKA